jgi:cell division protein FtsL
MCSPEYKKLKEAIEDIELQLMENKRNIDLHNVDVFKKVHEIETEVGIAIAAQEVRISKIVISLWCFILFISVGMLTLAMTDFDIRQQITRADKNVKQDIKGEIKHLTGAVSTLHADLYRLDSEVESNNQMLRYIMRMRGLDIKDIEKWNLQQDKRGF